MCTKIVNTSSKLRRIKEGFYFKLFAFPNRTMNKSIVIAIYNLEGFSLTNITLKNFYSAVSLLPPPLPPDVASSMEIFKGEKRFTQISSLR